ncbi:AAEL001402-PA [Aedes aegypti]|uniref:AAEL001402-PA n=1 Tax=Aedes aegypti TaxID=7159 RepID=Q17LC5_AEDAE|nr:AAEL001402-PA [Aedes aegypti]
MKIFYCAVLVVSLWSHVLGSQCLQPQSKNCIITSVDGSSDQFSLPNLSGKTSLHIKGGSLTNFGERLSNQLGSVQKLHLGPIGLKEIFLKADLLEVNAMNNEIHVVRFKPSEKRYKLEKLTLQGNRLKQLTGFEVLTSLAELHLEDNQLETIDFSVFAQMANLKELHLERNLLTRVESLNVISLPKLENLSLAGNKLTKLDVTNWNFESLEIWDVSSNELIYIDGMNIEAHFHSLQTFYLSGNEWHCRWLSDSLSMFNNSGVHVGDEDKRDDCDKLGDICCASVETLAESGDDKLGAIKKDQEAIREDLDNRIKDINESYDEKIKDLAKLLDNLQEKSKTPPTVPTGTFNTEEFKELTSKAMELKTLLKHELSRIEYENKTNEISVKTLEQTILELRRSLQRVAGNVSAVQKQFKLLRENTNKL